MSENLDINVTDSGSARRVAKDVRDIGPAAVASDKSVQLLNTGLGKLAGAVAGIASARVFLESLGVADDINDKLSLVVGTTGELTAVQDQLFQSSQKTGTQLSSNANLYAGLSQALSGTITDQNRLMNVTELVSKSLVVQGKSAGDVAGVMARFVAQLQQGELSGRGLTGVLTQFPELTNAIAVGLGVTTQQLVEMGKQGQLSTDMIIQGLERSSNFIDARFNVAAGGLTDSFNRLTNSIVEFAGKSGLLDFITGWLDTMAKGIQVITILWQVFRQEVFGVSDAIAGTSKPINNMKDQLANATRQGVKSFADLQKETDATNAKYRILGDTAEKEMQKAGAATRGLTEETGELTTAVSQATARYDEFGHSLDNASASANNLSSSLQGTTDAFADMATGGAKATQLLNDLIRAMAMFGAQIQEAQTQIHSFAASTLDAVAAVREAEMAFADAAMGKERQLAKLRLESAKERLKQARIEEEVNRRIANATFQQMAWEGTRLFGASERPRPSRLFGDLFGDFPGFQHGASFSVPGSGSPDSRLIKFWATPGEEVNVMTKRQQQERNRQGDVTNTFNLGSIVINTPDVAGFARSRQQFRLELLNDLRDVARKAGLDDLP